MNESLKTREFLQKENKIVRKAEKKKVAFFFLNHLSLDSSRNKK